MERVTQTETELRARISMLEADRDALRKAHESAEDKLAAAEARVAEARLERDFFVRESAMVVQALLDIIDRLRGLAPPATEEAAK